MKEQSNPFFQPKSGPLFLHLWYFKEDIIKTNEKIPNKIKKSIKKGKIIEKEKEFNENNLSSLVNDCIIIENYINDINKINNNT